MKRLRALLILLAVATGCSANNASAEPPGQIAVSPSMFELRLEDRPVTSSVRIRNLKERPVSLNVEVCNWTLDPNNELREIAPTEQSIDQWMVINPLAFTIEPGKEQVVRFSIRPRVKPDPGEHRAIIYFTEQPSRDPQTGVQLLFRLGVGVYAYVDPVVKKGALSSLRLDRTRKTIQAELTNHGNVHTRLKGNWSIWRKGTFPGYGVMAECLNTKPGEQMPEGFVAAGSMNTTPVLAGSQRVLSTSIPLPDAPEGGYEVAVAATVDGRRIEKLFP
ncbi:fimbria/pilus periplasmic chaperone [Chlorobium sp. N1]|uniref:fimbrial biogenesis chaperone n=1 Tax=Chlorobium sp. N1 TaxID=2491138 RepID=UPI00103A085B|nr:fimbria/pilus periplasmic chaperone [Chlorobium sp. N1]TCD47427.1 molecular chaperone [Chlorobium sp. N1]